MKLIIPGIGITLLLGWMIVSVSPCPSKPDRKPAPPPTPRPTPRPTPKPSQKPRTQKPRPTTHEVTSRTEPSSTEAPPPEVKVIRVTRTRGDPIMFRCRSILKGKLNDVQWLRNGAILKKSDRMTGGTVDNPDLTFDFLKEEDSGKYICSTSSPKGRKNGDSLYILTVEDCKPGFYGDQCLQLCGYCKENIACDSYTGHCDGCQPNWEVPWCQQLLNCSYNRYGRLCEYECGRCSNNVTCNYSTGYCKSCQSGWLKPLCQVEEGDKTDVSAQTVALSVGIGAPATLGAIAGILQLIKCLSSGLPTMPTCGAEDSDEKLEDEVIPIPLPPDQQQLLNALPMHALPTGPGAPAATPGENGPDNSQDKTPDQRAEIFSVDSDSDSN